MRGLLGRRTSRRTAPAWARVLAVVAVGLPLATVLVALAGEQPAAAYGPAYCSGYRWDVKTGQDPQAGQVNLTPVVPTTVGFLTSLPAHLGQPDDVRIGPTEFTVYQITGTIVDVALQHDNDYHVVMQDNSSNNVMIAEIPDPACVPSSSPFAARIANARSAIVANQATAVGKTVSITGVGFFDDNTLTSSVAPNKIELHPVLDINFNPGSPPPSDFFTMNANPSSLSVMQGGNTASSISTQVTGGSPQSVTLSASGLPSGAMASFSPNPINSGQSSTMTISASPSTPTGTYMPDVKGNGTSTSFFMSTGLTVTAGNDFSLGGNPNSVTVDQGQSATSQISTTVTNGSGQTVSLSASGLPVGATASFSPNPIAAGTSSTMTISTSLSTPVGDDYPVSVTATGSSASHSTPISLGVDPAPAYWMVATDGGVFSFGTAHYYGSMGGEKLNAPIAGMASTPDGGGYWLVASDGGIFSFGDAQFVGSTGALVLNRPVVGMAATPSGHGYWLVASDGGIFTFGDAVFVGSTGGQSLNKPIVGMAPTTDGLGYRLVASDGGIFTFGDAAFAGSMGGQPLNAPIVSMTSTIDDGGYWLAASDGGIFAFGNAGFAGSMGGGRLNASMIGMAAA